MLSDQQLSEFDRDGLVRLSSLFSAADAAGMRERLWDAMAAQHGIERDAPSTWTVEEPRHFQALSRAGVFNPIGSPGLVAAVDDLLGAGTWIPPACWGGPLITFPRPGAEWDVPHQRWHIDWPARGSAQPLFGIKVLAFLDAVEVRGGGTVVLSGSHRLVDRFVSRAGATQQGNSTTVRRALMGTHPWLRDLASNDRRNDRIRRFMVEGTEIEGIALRVVELTGTAGEAVLLHPWLFHAPAPNCTIRPRMMVGHGINTAEGVAIFASAV